MTTTIPRPSLLLCSAVCLASCTDERLRELGYTSDLGANLAQAGDPPPEAPAECERVFVSADQLLRIAAEDLASLPAAERPFTRYLSFAHRLDAGACSSELETDVFAVSKFLNMMSSAPRVVRPTSVGSPPVLVRVDLREYGWLDEVHLGGQTFGNGWEAIISANPFAVEVGGEDGGFLAGETGTRVPVLGADAFIGQAAKPEVYYALLGLPGTLGELRQSVGLPPVVDPAGAGALRTAVMNSRVLRSEGNLRVLDRYPLSAPPEGSYWEASHVETSAFLSDPLHAQPDVQRLIAFTLPNGMLAFAVTDAAGQRASTAERVLDTNRHDFTATVPLSCSGCHASGFIPAIDDVRAAILASPELFADEVIDAYAASPNDEERFQLVAADSSVYFEALARAGGSEDDSDPVASRFLQFENDIVLEAAAAELLVTPDALRARLGELSPGLLPLALELRLSRRRFGELYAEAYCELHGLDANPPVSCE